MVSRIVIFVFLIATSRAVIAQTEGSVNQTSSPTTLPGKVLAEHDFMYAGESHERRIFIVRKGRVVWTYDDPAGKGEISDAVMLSNGNILFAHQFGVTEITPDKKVIWHYDAPAGHEIHTALPIGREHVLYIQNGDPAVARVVDTVTNGKRNHPAGEAPRQHAWTVPSRPADGPRHAHGCPHGFGQGGGI